MLEELNSRHVEQLIILDERITGANNWSELADSIFHGDKKGIEQVNEIKRKHVGGNPAKCFLDTLIVSKPQTTVEKLKDVANELSRCDIAKVLEHVPSDTLIADLEIKSNKVYREVVNRLEYQGCRAVHNWVQFSEEFDFNPRLVNAQTRMCGSPTEDLIKLIKSSKDGFTLKDFKRHLLAIERPDVAKIIDKFKAEIVSKRGEQYSVTKGVTF